VQLTARHERAGTVVTSLELPVVNP
jgi:hypothetical protein